MVTSEPTKVGVKDARESFPAIVDAAAEGQRFVVTYYGRDRCAIVSVDDLHRLQKLDARPKPAPGR